VEFGVIVSNETEKYQYPDLEIVNSSSKIEADGNFTVTGNVVNTGAQASGKLWVVASFYNSTGEIIATGFSDYLTPEFLPAGESTSFTVSSADAVNELVNEMQVLAYKIRDYSLMVQTQTPIIPEFPVLPIVLMFAVATVTVVIFVKKAKLR
jgi:ABC-type transport system substrate-binding protein